LVTAVLASRGQILPSSPTPEGFPLWRAVTFVVSWAFLTLAIALVYRILPDAKIAWRDVWVRGRLQRPLVLARQSLDRLVSGGVRHHVSPTVRPFDRDCPVVGLLFSQVSCSARSSHASTPNTAVRL